MPRYRLNLEAEVHCPEDKTKPELTITSREVMSSLVNNGNYAVCVGNPSKLTAKMSIKKAELKPGTCHHCGSPVED